ncbi:unnamed protein product [Ostreobium quekettii]|uniref:Fatty acid desaturase domain-containing protein n=1 Tax=Ostreobium quekettii TaxID=121088 RepID=A0A8S1J6H9_9CHLO|nr:unnamed protein product [Ostreobium quekettii]
MIASGGLGAGIARRGLGPEHADPKAVRLAPHPAGGRPAHCTHRSPPVVLRPARSNRSKCPRAVVPGLAPVVTEAEEASWAREGDMGAPRDEGWLGRIGDALARWGGGPARHYACFLLVGAAYLAAFSGPACDWLARAVVDVPGLLSSAVPAVSRAQWLAVITDAVSFSGVIFVFGVMPLMDLILGRDAREAPEGAATDLAYDIPQYLLVPLHLGLLACLCLRAPALMATPVAFLGAMLSAGNAGGLAVTAAHNLLHSTKPVDKLLSKVLLWSTCYMHWGQSHLAHHVQIGTPHDPSTARFGEPLYSFLPRCIVGNFQDAIRLEKQRLVAKGQSLLSFHNRMFAWVVAPAVMLAAGWAVSGPPGVLMLLGQAVVAVLLLHSVDYVEHYGLRRDAGDRVGPQHSWNSDWAFSNRVFFMLQRHPDHHLHASVPYQVMKAHEGYLCLFVFLFVCLLVYLFIINLFICCLFVYLFVVDPAHCITLN